MYKILRGEVFIDPKRIKFMEHKKFKALPKISGQDAWLLTKDHQKTNQTIYETCQ